MGVTFEIGSNYQLSENFHRGYNKTLENLMGTFNNNEILLLLHLKIGLSNSNAANLTKIIELLKKNQSFSTSINDNL